MRLFGKWIFWVLCLGLFAIPLKAETINHKFQSDETLWFLAQIYYGQGGDYTKIMEANGIKSLSRVHDGKVLKIPNPLFKPDQPGFDLRLSHLREKRREALERRGVASREAPEVIREEPSTFEKAKQEVGGH